MDVFTDGRSSGPPHNREHHLTPPEMEDGASSTPGEQRGRQQIDHSSQLRQQTDQQVIIMIGNPLKPLPSASLSVGETPSFQKVCNLCTEVETVVS